MLHWYTYKTAGSEARMASRRIEPLRARWLELCWYWLAGLGVLGMLVMGFGAISEYRESEGLVLLLCAPLVALAPVTIGVALRRSARIERALDQLVEAARPPAAPADEAAPDRVQQA